MKKYNFLPKACHFIPFGWGNDRQLHYSYTRTRMYCKLTESIEDYSVEFVEARSLDAESKLMLDGMAGNDFVSCMHIFGSLVGRKADRDELDQIFYSYQMSASELSRLHEEIGELEEYSEEYRDISAQMDFVREDIRGFELNIQKITEKFNQESGYVTETGKISRNR